MRKNYHDLKNAFGMREEISKGKCDIMTCKLNIKRNEFLFGPDTS